ncbi:DUF3575 domain-containing protein [Prevotella sp.]|uniref:DUF3575 domain-containing protein n=1 Tax=Prevotella sp. TaxID=59823 RepID=UPI00264953CD|nr:DUF3575 domain-containing protein [Prevotella sp.]MDN5553882.1 DUF3575 domain-containing protein [Prevotella sp.]
MFRRIVDLRVCDSSVFILKYCFIFILQLIPFQLKAQYVVLKSNLLYDALFIPSLGTEVRLDSTFTLNISSTYCPISYNDNRKWKNWSVLYEARHWFRKSFNGPYIGVFGIHGGFNLSRLPIFHLSHHRAEGNFNGAGLTFGWHKILSPHWGIDTSLSVGYLHLRYRHYREGTYGYLEYTKGRNYVGPVSLSVSLVYIIR